MRNELELISNYSVEEASVDKLYAGDGVSTKMLQKYYPRHYKAKLTAVQDFMEQVMTGRRPLYHLRETMQGLRAIDATRYGVRETLTTSDFSNLFGDILDRQLLGQYSTKPKSWPSYVRRGVVNDFRTVRRLFLDGMRAPLTVVPEQTSYPAGKVTDGKYSYAVSKRGRTIPFSWEAIVNDDLDAFGRVPGLMADSVVNSEEKAVAQLFVDASGFLTAFFSNGNKNIVNTTNGSSANNPALAQTAIEDAATVLMAQTDADGDPIMVSGMVLVVPPHLAVLAEKLVNNIQSIRLGAGGSTSSVNVIYAQVPDWQRRLSVAVNNYLPIVNTTTGKTCWFLFSAQDTGRASAEIGFLRGHEDPEIFIKSPNARRLGGGEIDPLDGNFDSDSVEYKLRHVFGTTTLDPKGVVVSRGDAQA